MRVNVTGNIEFELEIDAVDEADAQRIIENYLTIRLTSPIGSEEHNLVLVDETVSVNDSQETEE